MKVFVSYIIYRSWKCAIDLLLIKQWILCSTRMLNNFSLFFIRKKISIPTTHSTLKCWVQVAFFSIKQFSLNAPNNANVVNVSGHQMRLKYTRPVVCAADSTMRCEAQQRLTRRTLWQLWAVRTDISTNVLELKRTQSHSIRISILESFKSNRTIRD